MAELSCRFKVRDRGIVVIMLILAAIFLFTTGQTDIIPQSAYYDGDNLFEELPSNAREEFRISLMKILELEKKGEWNAVYDWFDKEEVIHGKEIRSREMFLQEVQHVHLLKFVATGVYYIPPRGNWEIVGCAVFAKLPPIYSQYKDGVVSIFSARYTADGWRFGAPPGLQLDNGKAKGCVINEKSDTSP